MNVTATSTHRFSKPKWHTVVQVAYIIFMTLAALFMDDFQWLFIVCLGVIAAASLLLNALLSWLLDLRGDIMEKYRL